MKIQKLEQIFENYKYQDYSYYLSFLVILMSKRLYIGNLANTATEDDLEALFSKVCFTVFLVI